MKKVTTVAAIAIALSATTFSAAALAERGSEKLNTVMIPTSTAHYSQEDLTMSPSDLPAINGGQAQNEVLDASFDESQQTVADRTIKGNDLHSLNS